MTTKRKSQKPAIDRQIEMVEARPIASEDHLLPMIDPYVERRPAGAPGTVGRLIEVSSYLVAALYDDRNRRARAALDPEASVTLTELANDLARIQAMFDYQRPKGRGYRV
jgi:hypothetical protein